MPCSLAPLTARRVGPRSCAGRPARRDRGGRALKHQHTEQVRAGRPGPDPALRRAERRAVEPPNVGFWPWARTDGFRAIDRVTPGRVHIRRPRPSSRRCATLGLALTPLRSLQPQRHPSKALHQLCNSVRERGELGAHGVVRGFVNDDGWWASCARANSPLSADQWRCFARAKDAAAPAYHLGTHSARACSLTSHLRATELCAVFERFGPNMSGHPPLLAFRPTRKSPPTGCPALPAGRLCREQVNPSWLADEMAAHQKAAERTRRQKRVREQRSAPRALCCTLCGLDGVAGGLRCGRHLHACTRA